MKGHPGNPRARLICSGYVGTAICVFGLIGNILSVIVWTRINKRRSDSSKSAGLYLITLALVDSGVLVTFLCTESLQQLYPDVVHNLHYVVFYCYFGFPMYFFFIVASIWMVICVTYNRFVAVIIPHKAFLYNSLTATYTLIGCTLLFSFAVNVPHFFNFRPNPNKTLYEKTNYGKSQHAIYYDFVAHCMVLVLIPWITIFSLNTAIIYKMFSRKKNHGIMSEGKRERQLTTMLLVITISFLFFLIWQCLTQCFWMLKFGQNEAETWFDIDTAYGLARLGVIINSSVNFLLYCLSGAIFRKEILKIFNLCLGRSAFKFRFGVSTTSSSRSSLLPSNSEGSKDSYGTWYKSKYEPKNCETIQETNEA